MNNVLSFDVTNNEKEHKMESMYSELYERAERKSQGLPVEEQRLFLEYIRSHSTGLSGKASIGIC